MTATAPETAAMSRALELALRGPRAGVNPQVGCVLLDPDGRVLAEGWHRGAGTAHAEVDALSRLADPAAAAGATAVVTLEPCNHHGRTGPCSEALIAAGVSRVLYAVPDPGVASAGGGERMRAAGLDVESGLLRDEAEEAIRPWLTALRLGRPFVTVKWASSLDGRAAAADGSSRWITGPAARDDVHRRRGEHDAIVVGTGTVLADDPALTARSGDGLLEHQPIPVVIGTTPVPVDAAVRHHPHPLRVHATHDLGAVLASLFDDGVRSVFVEGGPTLASAFLRAGLVDEVVAYLAPTLLGGPITALGDLDVSTIDEQRRLRFTSVDLVGDDVRLVARPLASDTDPSARDGRTSPATISTSSGVTAATDSTTTTKEL
ncbi:bifunctional diaminohydroxyphosphoribosylaminopyrimidine deaminase/5-amino-6-(5-phosphoribosylamino)uracil reductase RibD [Cnuibacter sp. UC19_7]|uniref:bifunctional diaminohydroxyphosphoribosylaminopyrimidine deaminase/5-amino-6-(5-phosphoribosylamino)uracil reductase RibD n=1 Tax=Cnuibacter sp. UC19_7 TaxID=3350166 RepID=UPI0036721C2B